MRAQRQWRELPTARALSKRVRIQHSRWNCFLMNRALYMSSVPPPEKYSGPKSHPWCTKSRGWVWATREDKNEHRRKAKKKKKREWGRQILQVAAVLGARMLNGNARTQCKNKASIQCLWEVVFLLRCVYNTLPQWMWSSERCASKNLMLSALSPVLTASSKTHPQRTDTKTHMDAHASAHTALGLPEHTWGGRVPMS